MFVWQLPEERMAVLKGPFGGNNPFLPFLCPLELEGWPGRTGPSKASVRGGSGSGRVWLLPLALAWKALQHPNPPGDRASPCPPQPRLAGARVGRRAAGSRTGTAPRPKPEPPSFTRARPVRPPANRTPAWSCALATHPRPRWTLARCGWSRRTP